jgi:hypothetical protein
MEAGEEREFTVPFRASKGFFLPGEYVFGRLVWPDGATAWGALLWWGSGTWGRSVFFVPSIYSVIKILSFRYHCVVVFYFTLVVGTWTIA